MSCGCLAIERRNEVAHKKADLTGQKFGKLTVLYRVESVKKEPLWMCRCDCGNEKVVSTKALTHNAEPNCGCSRKSAKHRAPHIDLTGQKFSQWTVMEKDPKNGSKWICRCECGNIKSVYGNALRDGVSKHCGCKRIKDLSGQKFGRLTALEVAGKNQHNQTMWKCRCDCGNVLDVTGYYLTTGTVRSCGCLKSDLIAQRHTTHGKCNTPLYHIWSGMRDRCNNPNAEKFQYYGGRGIQVCDEWQDFAKFDEWARSNGWCDGLTLDRIDVDGNYCPENCRWVTWKCQQNNKRNSLRYEYNGESHTLSEWADIVQLPYSLLASRRERGWDVAKMLTTPRLR